MKPKRIFQALKIIILGENASKSVLVKQAFENAKEKELKDYKQKTSKEDFTFILYEPLGTEELDKQILELTGEDASKIPPYLKTTCKTGVAFGILESRPRAGGIEMPSIIPILCLNTIWALKEKGNSTLESVGIL
ncbi:hypothetical protein HpBGD112_03880 [Helicobacter pylori]